MASIAVIAMAGRFPGGLDSPEALWQALLDGRDLISHVPVSRWNRDRYERAEPGVGLSGAGRWGGFLEDIDLFDPAAFGISPREAETMDPAQRLLLDAAWRCGEAAGQRPSDWAGQRIGVFIGAFTQDYFLLQLGQRSTTVATPHTATGSMQTLLSNRISYCFRLTGPSMTIDTACSSSLVALHLAVRSLERGESEAALVGGAQLQLSPYYTAIENKGGFLSPDGRCRSFDHRANGYVRAEAVGMVLLMPLERALMDKLPIRAVIHGTATNHNGKPAGITLPDAEAQANLIRSALLDANLAPDRVGYVECHGTGTKAGDQAEITALGETLGRQRRHGAPFIGSVKANLGHAEAAAGITGLIKTVLCVENRMIPPHLHFERAPEGYDLTERGLRLALKPEAWPEGAAFAAINSFGFGGANAHAIIGPPPGRTIVPPVDATLAPNLLFLSGPTAAHVEEQVPTYRNALAVLATETDLAALSSASFYQRDHGAHRLVVMAANRAELIEKLDDYTSRPSAPTWIQGEVRDPAARRLAWVCAGMGPQWLGMGQSLAPRFEIFRDEFRSLADEFEGLSGRRFDLADVTSKTDEALPADVAQPMNLFLQIALGRLLNSLGVRPNIICGHSVGEIAAFHLAGAIDRTTALTLVFHRSRLQARVAGRGGMLAVGTDAGPIEPKLTRHGLCLAAVNGPSMISVAGPLAGLDAVAEELARDGVFCRRIGVDIAYHSRAMEPLEDEFRAAIGNLVFSTPELPLVSSVTGKRVCAEDLQDFPEYWWRNMREPVVFSAAAEACVAGGATLFQEISAHPVLRIYLRTLGEAIASIATLRRDRDDVSALLESLATLHVYGLTPDWEKLIPRPRTPVSLPGFVFRKSRFWSESPEKRALRLAEPDHPLLGYRRSGSEWIWDCDLGQRDEWSSHDHVVLGQPRMPAAAFIEMLHAAHRQIVGDGPCAIIDFKIETGVRLLDAGEVRLTTVADERSGDIAIKDGDGRVLVEARFATTNGARRKAFASANPQGRLDPEAFYASTERLGIRYDGAFRCIGAIAFDAKACHAQIIGEPLAGFAFAPAALDGALQAILAYDIARSDETTPVSLRLPVSIGEIVILQSPGADDYPLMASVHNAERDAEISTCDVILTDRRGYVVAELHTVSMKALTAPSAFSGGRHVYGSFFNLEWRDLTPVLPEICPNRQWIVVTDSAAALTARLSERGLDVAQIGAHEVTDALKSRADCPRTIVDLTHLSWNQGPEFDQSAILLAAERYRVLSATAREGDEIWAVTRGAYGSGPNAPVQRALWGIARAQINVERSLLWRGVVDIEDIVEGTWPDALIDLIHANPRETEFRLSGEGWSVPQVSACPPPRKAPLWLRGNASYLVTGAFGALGSLSAQFLVDHGARHLVFLSSGQTQSERHNALIGSFQRRGVMVLAEGFNLADPKAWADFLHRHKASGQPPIRGVIHAAGATADRPLESLQTEDLAKVLDPKVAGVRNLLEAIGPQSLDFLVFYSSISGLLPAYGQSAYAAANLYLDAYAGHLAAQGVPARAIAWGPWTIGMAARTELGDIFRKGGLMPFNEQEGYRALSAALQSDTIETICAAIDWATFAASRPGRLWLLGRDLLNATRPAVPARSRDLESLSDDERKSTALADLIAIAGQVMRLPPDLLSGHANLSLLGLDSLMAIEMQMMIAAAWGCDLDLAELMGREPLDRLSEILARNSVARPVFAPCVLQ